MFARRSRKSTRRERAKALRIRQALRECSVHSLHIWYVLALSIIIRWTMRREENRRKGDIYERKDCIYWPWQYGTRDGGQPPQGWLCPHGLQPHQQQGGDVNGAGGRNWRSSRVRPLQRVAS